jgi:hypothetical protein
LESAHGHRAAGARRRLRAWRFGPAEELAEQTAEIWRLALRGLRLLLKRAGQLSTVDLRNVLVSELPSGEHAEDDRRQHHQEPSRLVGLESARLLNALLHRVLVLTKHS